MNRSRHNPLFWSVAIVAAAVVLAEAAWVGERVWAADRAQRELQRKRQELRALLATSPAPIPGVASQIESDVARASQMLVALHADLNGRGPAAQRLQQTEQPGSRADAFFELAAFGERLRERARRLGVELKTDERFGFAAYAHAGPELESISAVMRQSRVVEFLLETLFEAHPHRLEAVRRERPCNHATASHGAGETAGTTGTGGADYFEIDPRISARVPGFVDARAFRVVFVGDTAVLRGLLNALAEFESPLVVRAVEVEPVAPLRQNANATSLNLPVPPLVSRSLSRFTVTVEFITLAEPALAVN